MAIQFARECQFANNLESSTLNLLQEIGDRMAENINLLKEVENTITDELNNTLSQADQALEELFTFGDRQGELKSGEDLERIFGLPKAEGTQTDDESFLLSLGIIMFDGVIYLPGSASPTGTDVNNVEMLRRLYFALGRDLNKVNQYINDKAETFVQNRINLTVVNPKDSISQTMFTLSEIKQAYNASYLTVDDVVTLENSRQLVLLPYNLLDVNKSITVVKNAFSLTQNTKLSFFHKNAVNTDASAYNRYTAYGLAGEYLNAVYSGADYKLLTGNNIQSNITNNQNLATQVFNSNLSLINRFEVLTAQSIASYQARLTDELDALLNNHYTVINDYLFDVNVINKVNILDLLRSKHNDSKIVELLEIRTDIQGLYFEATREEILTYIKRNMGTQPGSTKASNKVVNATSTDPFQKKVLLSMYGSLIDAKNVLVNRGITKNSLQVINSYLNSYIISNAAGSTTSNNIPLKGQPIMTTPSSVMATYYNPATTLNMPGAITDVSAASSSLINIYPPAVAAALSRVLNIVTDVFSNAMNASNIILGFARNAILPFKKKLDAFFSKYLSMTGSGVFETSLLKCAINFDIGLTTDILDQLLSLLDNLGVLVSRFLSTMANWLSNLVEKILCYPIQLIDSLLGQVTANLPSICQTPGLSLGVDVETALRGLRSIADSQYSTFKQLSGDIIKYRAFVSTAPEKISQFKAGASCKSPSMGSFVNATLLNVSGAF